MNTRLVTITAALAALSLFVPGASADSTGDHRVLVILATWGPQPWSAEDVRTVVFAEADAFLRRSSFGQLSMHGDVTPWLPAYPQRPACPVPTHERVAPGLSDGPLEAARTAGYSPATYDRVVYVVPRTECDWNAVGVGREVLLNGMLSAWLVVHELGHTYGLAHAHGAICTGGVCRPDEYGDPFSPMGRGLVDFSAYEKLTMGWIRNVVRTGSTGSYRIGRPDMLTAPPHALVVATGSGDYWFEQRLDVDPPGLAVRVIEPDVPDDDLAPPTRFQHDPTRTGKNVVGAGEVFRSSGAFSVRYTPLADGSADLQFAWTDRVRPSRPVLISPARSVRATRPFRVAWRTDDIGSGVAFCTVRLDRRVVARAEGATTAAGLVVPGVKPGLHLLSVTCTDRAGNVSAAGLRRVHVVR
jgi:gametolysin peptidase M11